MSVPQSIWRSYSASDGRGRHSPPNKTPEWKKDVIRRHIESFPTTESHYCRAKTARHYLDSKLSLKRMYEDFGPFFEKNLPPANETGDVRKPTEKVYRDIFCSRSMSHERISVQFVLKGMQFRGILKKCKPMKITYYKKTALRQRKTWTRPEVSHKNHFWCQHSTCKVSYNIASKWNRAALLQAQVDFAPLHNIRKLDW